MRPLPGDGRQPVDPPGFQPPRGPIVPPGDGGVDQERGRATVEAEGVEQHEEQRGAPQGAREGRQQEPEMQPGAGPPEAVPCRLRIAPPTAGSPGDQVLQGAQGADAGAVDPTEEECRPQDQEKPGRRPRRRFEEPKRGWDELKIQDRVPDADRQQPLHIGEEGRGQGQEGQGDQDPQGLQSVLLHGLGSVAGSGRPGPRPVADRSGLAGLA